MTGITEKNELPVLLRLYELNFILNICQICVISTQRHTEQTPHTKSGWIFLTHFYQYVHLVFGLRHNLRTLGLVTWALGHKQHLFVALTWGSAGDMPEELLDSDVARGAPEGAGCKHVEERVDAAADEDHGSSDEDCGAPDSLQLLCHVRRGVYDAQDDEGEDVSYVMRRPANGKHDHHAGNQDCGLVLGLDGHLSDPAAHAAVADHEDGEG